MNIFRSRKPRSRIVSLDRSQPLAFHLSPGSAVYAVDGLLWVTQEGLMDDVVLKPGQRFDVRDEGLIVANAVEEPARVYIAADDSAARDMMAMTTESVQVLHRRALELRRHEIARRARLIQHYCIRAARGVKAVWRRSKWSPAL
ncbi:MAG TPA: DUF2917 domain-containing protein [Burkholderiales bacterium]